MHTKNCWLLAVLWLLAVTPARADGRLRISKCADGQGFTVMAGNTVVGRCTRGSYDVDALPEGLQWWLKAMEEEVGDTLKAADEKETDQQQAIAPMLTSRWGQHEPYNQQCPTYNGQATLTGCVATAMAQVMYYYQWPAQPTTAISAYETRSLAISVPQLPPTVFDWSVMAPAYDRHSTETAQSAVAALMRYCGQAVQMDYNPESSGAYLAEAAEALSRCFGYDTDVCHVSAAHYTQAQWQQLMLSELQAGRPVIMAGQTSSGSAHAFVCDGYDGNGMFHINWGWTGDYDGYYRLPRLKPNANNYSTNCDAVIGIQPPDGTDHPAPPERLAGRNLMVSGLTASALMINLNTEGAYYEYGWQEVDADGSAGTVYDQQTRLFGAKRGWTVTTDVAAYGLARGTHRLVPVARRTGTETWWPLYNDATYVEARMQNSHEGRLLLSPATTLNEPDLTAWGVQLADTVCYKDCPAHVRLLLTCHVQDYDGDIYLWPNSRQCTWAGHVSISAGDTLAMTATMTFDEEGVQTVSVTGDPELEYVAGTGEVTVQPFVETEGLLRLLHATLLMEQPQPMLALTVANDADTDYIGYLFVRLLQQQPDGETWQEAAATDTLILIKAGNCATELLLPIGNQQDGGGHTYAVTVDCQDFGSPTPYGTTHALTDGPRLLTTDMADRPRSDTASGRKATLYTLGGRPAKGCHVRILVSAGRKFLYNSK